MNCFCHRSIVTVLAGLLSFSGMNALAQSNDSIYNRPVSPYSGFRVGMLHVSGDILPYMRAHYEMLNPTMTQVGWQFDKKIKDLSIRNSLNVETTVLLSGFEQSIALPSVGSMVNWRYASGFEAGGGLIMGSWGGLSVGGTIGGILRFGRKTLPINLVAAVNSQAFAISLRFNLRSRKSTQPSPIQTADATTEE